MDSSSLTILLLPPFCFVLLILLTVIVDALTQSYEHCHRQVNCGRIVFWAWQLCGTVIQLFTFPFSTTMMVLEVVLNVFLFTMETANRILSVGCNDRMSFLILSLALGGALYYKNQQTGEAPVE